MALSQLLGNTHTKRQMQRLKLIGLPSVFGVHTPSVSVINQ